MDVVRKAVRAEKEGPAVGLFATNLEHCFIHRWWNVAYSANWRELEVRIVDAEGTTDYYPKWFSKGNMVGKIISYLGKPSKFPGPLNLRFKSFEVLICKRNETAFSQRNGASNSSSCFRFGFTGDGMYFVEERVVCYEIFIHFYIISVYESKV